LEILDIYNRRDKKKEKAVLDMAYLRVVSMVINNVGKKEVLLNSRLQIVSITRKMAAANKVS